MKRQDDGASGTDVALEQITRSLAEVLGKVAHDPETARLIARRAGFPSGYLPEFKTPTMFWALVLEQVAMGRTAPGMLVALVDEVLGQLPHNAELGTLAKQLQGQLVALERRPDAGPVIAVASASERPTRASWKAAAAGAALVFTVLVAYAVMQRPDPLREVTTAADATPVEPAAVEVASPMDAPLVLTASVEPPALPLDPPPVCRRDADCGAGWRCALRGGSKQLLGTVTKALDRDSHSQIIGRACTEGMKRIGRPRGKISGRSDVECRLEWRVADERSCEVDALVLGPAYEGVRCDVYATLQPDTGIRGHCTPR